MCDYSLEFYRSRSAVPGETYVLHRFRGGTRGFVSPGDCYTAVCMPSGGRLRLSGIGDTVRRAYGVGQAEEAVMLRLPPGRRHRDGVRFANGCEVSLQCFGEGVTATLMLRELADLLGLPEAAAGRSVIAA